MGQDKKFKTALSIIIVLLLICLGQAAFILHSIHGKGSADQRSGGIEDLSSSLFDMLQQEQRRHNELFDRFFGEDFFHNNDDPFSEMERIRKELEKMMGASRKKLFDSGWETWFNDRFLGYPGGMQIDQKEEKDRYLITITIPNLKENRVNIKIVENMIHISGEFSQTAEKRDSSGNIISKKEIRRSLSQTIPVPPGCDPSKANVENKKDKIVITLPKVEK